MLTQKTRPSFAVLVLSAVLLGSIVLSSCSAQTPFPYTPQPSSTQPAATMTLAVQAAATEKPTATKTQSPPPTSTPTMRPTSTLAPTATQVPPTATPTLGLDSAVGISGWCQPAESMVLPIAYSMPLNGKPMGYKDGALEINSLPSTACNLFFTFNRAIDDAAAKAMKVQFFEVGGNKPWLESPLTAVADQPNTAGVQLTHAYIIAPPFWDINYEMALVAADGSTLLHIPAHLHRWKPAKCYNGEYPNLTTMRCPLWQDLHPWDPAYKKWIPTYTPHP